MKKKYDDVAQRKIQQTLKKWKAGELKSGTSGKTVTKQKQAVAIGISEARREGGRVPEKKKS